MKIHTFAVLALLVSACSGQTLYGRMSLVSEWNGGFNGMLVVPITEQFTDGWTLQVQFLNPVTNLQV